MRSCSTSFVKFRQDREVENTANEREAERCRCLGRTSGNPIGVAAARHLRLPHDL